MNNDPMFAAIVAQMYNLLLTSKVTPYELKDAAYMAKYIMQTHVQPMHLFTNYGDKGYCFENEKDNQ